MHSERNSSEGLEEIVGEVTSSKLKEDKIRLSMIVTIPSIIPGAIVGAVIKNMETNLGIEYTGLGVMFLTMGQITTIFSSKVKEQYLNVLMSATIGTATGIMGGYFLFKYLL